MRRSARVGLLAWVLLAMAGPVALYSCWDLVQARPSGVRVALDDYDLDVYYRSARWVVGEGTLYRDVRSEYPLAANLVFAAVRIVAGTVAPFADPVEGFYWTWMSVAWIAYVAVLRRVSAELSSLALGLWLNPAVLYFTVNRFDIYPAALTLLWLLAARQNRVPIACGWLGLAIAVKGYPLFLLPVFSAFVWHTAGARRAVLAVGLCLGPFVAANAAALAVAGYHGMSSPYRLHAQRKLDTESTTYDAAAYVTGSDKPREIVRWPRLPLVAQLGGAFVALALFVAGKGDPFARMVHAGVVALVGLVSFSMFYSPQFVLWMVPLVSCSRSPALHAVMHANLAASLWYFPFTFDLRRASGYQGRWDRAFRSAIVAATVSRLALLVVAVFDLLRVQDREAAK
jgi:hypothetical protein